MPIVRNTLLGLEAAFYGDSDQGEQVSGIAALERGEAGFFGALKDRHMEDACLVKPGEKSRDVKVFAGAGCGRALGVYRGEVHVPRFVDRQGVEQGFYPFPSVKGGSGSRWDGKALSA
jgi:hypothetical protein